MKSSQFILVMHDAEVRKKHFDLRFQFPDNSNKWVSFAFNKFPPTKYGEKVYIVRTNDHSTKAATFLGRIPSGQYGAGTLTKEDGGTCDVEKFTNAHMIVTFHGGKLKGKYHIIATAVFGGKHNYKNKTYTFFKAKEQHEVNETMTLVEEYLTLLSEGKFAEEQLRVKGELSKLDSVFFSMEYFEEPELIIKMHHTDKNSPEYKKLEQELNEMRERMKNISKERELLKDKYDNLKYHVEEEKIREEQPHPKESSAKAPKEDIGKPRENVAEKSSYLKKLRILAREHPGKTAAAVTGTALAGYGAYRGIKSLKNRKEKTNENTSLIENYLEYLNELNTMNKIGLGITAASGLYAGHKILSSPAYAETKKKLAQCGEDMECKKEVNREWRKYVNNHLHMVY